MRKTSELSGFYKLSPEERLKIVQEFAGLSEGPITMHDLNRDLILSSALAFPPATDLTFFSFFFFFTV